MSKLVGSALGLLMLFGCHHYYLAKNVALIGLDYPPSGLKKTQIKPLVDEDCAINLVTAQSPPLNRSLKNLSDESAAPIFFDVHVEDQHRGAIAFFSSRCIMTQARAYVR